MGPPDFVATISRGKLAVAVVALRQTEWERGVMRHFDRAQLDRVFEPRSIAVVGDKRSSGYGWLHRFKEFDGALSSVHTNPESAREIEALGIRNYATVLEVPRPLDYVVVNTPRRTAVDVFSQCVEAGVGGVAYFTSGFAEADEAGRALQDELARMSRESGVVLLGPNCMGVYNPGRNIPSSAGMPLGEVGRVAMVGQSGTHSGYFARALFAWHGLRERRGVSFGNASVLDAADLVEYLGDDDRVDVLAAYLEGIGDRGQGDHERFTRALRRVAARKPAVIWKGGNTHDGARVTANHTAALPVAPEDWAWILSAAGAIGVDSMEALVDTTATLSRLGRLTGPRAGLLVLTGGQGPAITDTFARHGLRVPPLAERSLEELASYFDPIGGSFQNPLDAAYATETPAMLARDLDVLDRDPHVDFVAMDFFSMIMSAHRVQNDYGLGQRFRKDIPEARGERFIDAIVAHTRRATKPFFAIVSAAETEREGLELREVLRDAGVLVFASAERAAIAYAKALGYWSSRAGE
jgi:acyl-CoA synthetase (NDP forming)